MNLPLPPWWKWAALALAGMALVWWANSCYQDQRQREVGAATQAHERAERAVAALDSVSTAYAERERAWQDSVAALERDAAEADRRAAQAEQRAENAAQAVRDAQEAVDAVVQDSTLAGLIRAEREAHEDEVQALRDQIGELEVQVVAQRRTIEVQAEQIEASQELVASLRTALEERTEEAERWREAAEPGFFEGFISSASQIGTTLLLVGGLALIL